MKTLLYPIWVLLVRWRTWIVNTLTLVALALPELSSSPDFLAIFPEDYQRWVLAAVPILNIWMRYRPAVMAHDPEVQMKATAVKSDFTGEHA